MCSIPAAGRLLPAGATVVFPNGHLHANGADTTARLDVGFKFHPRGYEPTVREEGVTWASVDLDLEPMDPDQEIDIYFTVPKPLKMTIFEPHMHAAGVRMCLEAIWGQMRETLNCVGYDHSWVQGPIPMLTTRRRFCRKEPSCALSATSTTRRPIPT